MRPGWHIELDDCIIILDRPRIREMFLDHADSLGWPVLREWIGKTNDDG